MLTTFTIFNIVGATGSDELVSGLTVDEDEVAAAVDVIGWFGWVLAVLLFVAMVFQVICAVKLRDGARWTRTVLLIVSALSVIGVAADVTSWSAWLLLAADAVAVTLVFGSAASAYLTTASRRPLEV